MYGQKNYNEIMGRNGVYRIAQVGCFITAFANLCERFNIAIDPLGINRSFMDNGIYVDIDDGVRDDVGFDSISRLFPNVVVTGTHAGSPSQNNAIVKLPLRGSGTYAFHFCLVADHANQMIVDSWDGVVKKWTTYGNPISYATYQNNTPTASKPQAPAIVPTSSAFDGVAVTVLPGWGLSHISDAAGLASNPDTWTEIARLNGSENWQNFNIGLAVGQRIVVKAPTPSPQPVVASNEFVTVQEGQGLRAIAQTAGYPDFETPNSWTTIAALNGSGVWQDFNNSLVVGQQIRVRPAVVSTPPPVAPPVIATPIVDEAVAVKVSLNPSFKDSYVEKPGNYKARASIVVKDLEGLHADLNLLKGKTVIAAGTFVRDGVTYIRGKKHAEQNKWYGIPESQLDKPIADNKELGRLVTDDELTDEEIKSLDIRLESKEMMHNYSFRENVIRFIGQTMYLVSKINIFQRKQK